MFKMRKLKNRLHRGNRACQPTKSWRRLSKSKKPNPLTFYTYDRRHATRAMVSARSSKAPSWLLSALATLLLVTQTSALYFYIDSTTPKCFYEELPKDTLVVGKDKCCCACDIC